MWTGFQVSGAGFDPRCVQISRVGAATLCTCRALFEMSANVLRRELALFTEGPEAEGDCLHEPRGAAHTIDHDLY